MEGLIIESLVAALKSSPVFLVFVFIIYKQYEEVKLWKEKYLDSVNKKIEEDKENIILLHKISLILDKYKDKLL